MALTWDQLGNLGLTAGQKTKLAQFETIGLAAVEGMPDISGVNLAQAKAVDIFTRDVNTLIGAAQRGAQYVRRKIREDAAQAADDAVSTGTL